MNLYKRILLTLPFAFFVIIYYKFNNPDEHCYGLVSVVFNPALRILLVISGYFALKASFYKHDSNKVKAQPITFTITLFLIFLLVYNTIFRGHNNGEELIYAECKDENSTDNQSLILRRNNNFTVNLNHVDFGCSISGAYKKSRDTIFLDQTAIYKTDEKMTSTYIIKSNKIIPLIDSINKRTFTIVSLETNSK